MNLFLTLEGPEGSGKTTQIALLQQWLESEGRAVFCTREPGGTPIGEQIRRVLHDVSNAAMCPATEALLYSAARAQLVHQVIRPALARGEIVISDRFAESTFAYQGYGRGLSLDILSVVTAFATGGLRPDLVVYLDIDVAIGLERKLRDRREGRGEWNRMDQLAEAFYRRVRKGYLHMAQEEPDRWLVVDATESIEAIHARIRRRVQTMLNS